MEVIAKGITTFFNILFGSFILGKLGAAARKFCYWLFGKSHEIKKGRKKAAEWGYDTEAFANRIVGGAILIGLLLIALFLTGGL